MVYEVPLQLVSPATSIGLLHMYDHTDRQLQIEQPMIQKEKLPIAEVLPGYFPRSHFLLSLDLACHTNHGL